MSIRSHRFILDIEIDDEILAEHDGEQSAPPNEIEDWEGGDLFRAADLCLIESHSSTVYYEGLSPDE